MSQPISTPSTVELDDTGTPWVAMPLSEYEAELANALEKERQIARARREIARGWRERALAAEAELSRRTPTTTGNENV